MKLNMGVKVMRKKMLLLLLSFAMLLSIVPTSAFGLQKHPVPHGPQRCFVAMDFEHGQRAMVLFSDADLRGKPMTYFQVFHYPCFCRV